MDLRRFAAVSAMALMATAVAASGAGVAPWVACECLPRIQCPETALRARDGRSIKRECVLPSGEASFCCERSLTCEREIGSAAVDCRQRSAPEAKAAKDAKAAEAKLAAAKAAMAKAAEARAVELKMREALAEGARRVALAKALPAAELPDSGPGPAVAHFHSLLPMPRPDDKARTDLALKLVHATRHFVKRASISIDDVRHRRLPLARQLFSPGEQCPSPPPCDPAARYRRLDGVCNNLREPTLGAARAVHTRILPANYADGVWSPRVSVVGRAPLPSARLLSAALLPDYDVPHPYASLLHTLWGQFISHDITFSASFKDEKGRGVRCCTEGGGAVVPSVFAHFSCLPIQIPEDDPFYAPHGQRCMNFARTQLGLKSDCSLGPASQVNSVSSFLDGSVVYGLDEQLLNTLRTRRGGLLRSIGVGGSELPPTTDIPQQCGAVAFGPCFLGGDTRTNQMIGLVAQQALFVRQHNRVARALAAVNPRWDDERLFRETHKVVTAQLQHIVYNEWLPILLGNAAMSDYRLWVQPDGYAFDYDVSVDPSTSSEFSGAAFRFGHSTVVGWYRVFHHESGAWENTFLPEMLFNSTAFLQPAYFDNFFAAVMNMPMQSADNAFTQGLTNYLFRGSGGFGMDLAALNIQRGLDFGLPTYNEMRVLQGLRSAASFRDFEDRITPEAAASLAAVYASPLDVDLYVGGLLERAAPGALLGPTFLGVVADQFSRLKRGDRFFYELGGQPHSFTLAQLGEIKKTRLARLLCDLRDRHALDSISPQPLILPFVTGNEPVRCDELPLPQLDLNPWIEA